MVNQSHTSYHKPSKSYESSAKSSTTAKQKPAHVYSDAAKRAIRRAKAAQVEGCGKILVHNLLGGSKECTLRRIFGEFEDTIVSVKIIYCDEDIENGRSIGQIVFSSRNAAGRAVKAMRGYDTGSGLLRLEYAWPKPTTIENNDHASGSKSGKTKNAMIVDEDAAYEAQEAERKQRRTKKWSEESPAVKMEEEAIPTSLPIVASRPFTSGPSAITITSNLAISESIQSLLAGAQLSIVPPPREFIFQGESSGSLTMPITVFCKKYNLGEDMTNRLQSNGFRWIGAFCEVTKEDLMEIGFKSGDIVTLKQALKMWAKA